MSTADTIDPAAAPLQAEVKSGVVAYLELDGVIAAAKFYEKALDARIVAMHPPDDQGRTMHVHLHLNGDSLMLGDPYPDYGHPHQPAQGYTLMLPVADADFWFDRAVAAGCEPVMPPQEMFWGDRFGQFRDPFGVLWAVNQAMPKPEGEQ